MSFSVSGLESHYNLYKDRIKTKSDAVALFVHWYLIRNDFKCLRDDGKLTEVLPESWINPEEQVHLVKYTKDSRGYELKILTVDEHVMINLARLKDERFASLTVTAADHVNRVDNEFEGVYKNLQDLYEKIDKEFNSLVKSPLVTVSEVKGAGPRSPERERKPERPPQYDPLRVRPPIERVPPTNIGRSDLDPFYFDPLGGGGMIFDPFRTGGVPRPRIPSDLPPGSVPPGARFDPFQPPNPDARIPGSSRMGPNPDNLQKPPGYDDMFM